MSIPAIEPGGFSPLLPPTVTPTVSSTGVDGAAALVGSDGVAGASAASGAAAGGDFASMLSGGIERLQGLHERADQLSVQAATGDLRNLHDYTIAATEASVTTQLTTAVRNKALEAFSEIMRMSV